MSPRAAWRLEALGFTRVHDYVGGKADWLGHALPREGTNASVPYAGDVADPDPPTCALASTVSEVSARLDGSRYGFAVVLNDQRIVLGRVRRSRLAGADPDAPAETVMEAGPSTVRANTPASELVDRLTARELRWAIVTTPEGRLIGVFDRVAPGGS